VVTLGRPRLRRGHERLSDHLEGLLCAKPGPPLNTNIVKGNSVVHRICFHGGSLGVAAVLILLGVTLVVRSRRSRA
jgi:hypothetical protein